MNTLIERKVEGHISRPIVSSFKALCRILWIFMWDIFP